MTIAAAFICSDGIVLAADTEYTYNYSKYEGQKIFAIPNANCEILIAGAGTMDLVKMVVADLERELRDLTDLESLQQKIISRAEYANDHYILPRAGMAVEQYQLLLLVAIQMNDGGPHLLLKVHDDKVFPVLGSEFIGAGDEIARLTSSWLYRPPVSTKVMVQIAMHILCMAKENATNCGKTTLVVTLPRVKPRVRELTFFDDSKFFWDLHQFLQPIIVGCIDTQMSEQARSTLAGPLRPSGRTLVCPFESRVVAP